MGQGWQRASALVGALAALLSCGSRTGLSERGGASDGSSTEPLLDCPTSNQDPRLAGFRSGQTASLDVAAFVVAPVAANRWTVHADDCDAILPSPSFTVENAEGAVLELTPGRPGPYRVTLEVSTVFGETEGCEFEVPVAGRGIRVDLCWDTSTSVDLDLYVHTPLNQNPYYAPGALLVPDYLVDGLTEDTCNPANCTATPFGYPAAFGLADSPLEFCQAGPSATDFVNSGRCPNPRSGRDNNQSDATGTAEVVQIDNPNAGDTLRVMVQNFDNLPAQPRVFVYCNGERRAALELPGAPSTFVTDLERLPGVLWRAADITAQGQGDAIDCSVTPLEHPDAPGSAFVTVNDDRY